MSESKIPGLIEDLRRQIAEAKADADLAIKLAGQANNGILFELMLAMKASGYFQHSRCANSGWLPGMAPVEARGCLACFLDDHTILLAGSGTAARG